MADDDDTPVETTRIPRPGSRPNRDQFVAKHPTPPAGVPILEGQDDDLTPPPMNKPDEIEIRAMRIDKRHDTINKRPGMSPSPEAVNTAITIHAVRSELKGEIADVKQHFTTVIAGVSSEIGGVKASLVGVESAVKIFPALVEDLRAERTAATTELRAERAASREQEGHLRITEIDIGAAKEKDKIARGAWWRDNVGKVIGGAVTVGAALAAAFAAGRC